MLSLQFVYHEFATCTILSYLTIFDISSMDRAIGCKRIRPLFLNALVYTTVENYVRLESRSLLTWLQRRRVRLKRILCSLPVSPNDPFIEHVENLRFSIISDHKKLNLQSILSKARNLKVLAIPSHRIHPQSIFPFESSKQLTILDLSFCSFTDELTNNWLLPFQNLKELSLNRSNITNDEIVSLQSLPALTSLDLSDCYAISDTGVKQLPVILPNLLVLVLNHLCYLCDDGLMHLLRTCQHLRSLSIRGCHRINGSTLSSIVRDSSLVTIDASRCTGFKKTSLELLNTRLTGLFLEGCYFLKPRLCHGPLTNLAKISFASCGLMDECFLIEFLTNAPLLTHLGLANCYRISGVTLNALKTICRHLKYMSLEGNGNVTDRDIKSYLASRPTSLVEIDVRHCQFITSDCIKFDQKVIIRVI